MMFESRSPFDEALAKPFLDEPAKKKWSLSSLLSVCCEDESSKSQSNYNAPSPLNLQEDFIPNEDDTEEKLDTTPFVTTTFWKRKSEKEDEEFETDVLSEMDETSIMDDESETEEEYETDEEFEADEEPGTEVELQTEVELETKEDPDIISKSELEQQTQVKEQIEIEEQMDMKEHTETEERIDTVADDVHEEETEGLLEAMDLLLVRESNLEPVELSILRERDEEFTEINRSFRQINEIQTDLAVLVDSQEAGINKLSEMAADSAEHAEGGLDDLVKAVQNDAGVLTNSTVIAHLLASCDSCYQMLAFCAQ